MYVKICFIQGKMYYAEQTILYTASSWSIQTSTTLTITKPRMQIGMHVYKIYHTLNEIYHIQQNGVIHRGVFRHLDLHLTFFGM